MNDLLSWFDTGALLATALVLGAIGVAWRTARGGRAQVPRSLSDLFAADAILIAVDVHPDGACALTARDLASGAVRARAAITGRDGKPAALRVLGAVGDRLCCGNDELGLHLRDAATLDVVETQAALCARCGVNAPLASWRNAQAALLDTGELRLLGANGRRVTLHPGVDGAVHRPDTWRPERSSWKLDDATEDLRPPRFQAGTDEEVAEEAMLEFEERRRAQAETRLALAADFCLPVRYEPDLPDGSLLTRHQGSVDDPRLVLGCLTPEAVRWTAPLGTTGDMQVSATPDWVIALVSRAGPPELFGIRLATGEIAWRARL